jgi:hypothetical protein
LIVAAPAVRLHRQQEARVGCSELFQQELSCFLEKKLT